MMARNNGVMMQYFEWFLEADPPLWIKLKEDAGHLRNIGITAVWTPPAYKGAAGRNDVGYGTYDLYDLGEFDQKGTIPTKYGTKQAFLEMIEVLHDKEIEVYADIVLDHKMGADATELIEAESVDARDRMKVTQGEHLIEAWTKFTFPQRNQKYSDYIWSWKDFDGIDYDQKTKQQRIFRFTGKQWDSLVDHENANYDYLMGADIDFDNPQVQKELSKWGNWFLQTTKIDGFRLDALKHIQFTFYQNWLKELREKSQRPLFTVGEYWSGNIDDLIYYLNCDHYSMSLFDVPLHYHFYEASRSNGQYDLRNLLKGTLLEYDEFACVTFVDNHDTQPGQSLQSWVADWFKPMAYAVILLRKQGYPCIFYGDYYGIAHDQIKGMQQLLDTLLCLRNTHAYGPQIDYFDDPHIVGFTREGDSDHPYGLGVLFTDNHAGKKYMRIGKQHAYQKFYDVLHPHQEAVILDEQGGTDFFVEGGSLSIYIPFDDAFFPQ